MVNMRPYAPDAVFAGLREAVKLALRSALHRRSEPYPRPPILRQQPTNPRRLQCAYARIRLRTACATLRSRSSSSAPGGSESPSSSATTSPESQRS